MFIRPFILFSCIYLATCADPKEILPPTFGPNSTILPPTPTSPNPITTTPHSTPTTVTTTPKSPTTKTTATTTTATTSTIKPPITTTTTKPSPSPTPKPDDKPAVNDYIGNYTGSTRICLMAKMALQIELLAEHKNSTFINIEQSPKYEVSCLDSKNESLSISGKNITIDFSFLKNGSNYQVQSIVINLSPDINSTVQLRHNKTEFSVSDKLAYYCARDEPLNLTDNNGTVVAKLHISSFKYEAFVNLTNPTYSSVWDCDGVNTSDVVPIVVGCVLAVLVLLVLGAYLVGRRRCQARGYLSMFSEERSEGDYIPMKTLSCFK